MLELFNRRDKWTTGSLSPYAVQLPKTPAKSCERIPRFLKPKFDLSRLVSRPEPKFVVLDKTILQKYHKDNILMKKFVSNLLNHSYDKLKPKI